MQEATESQSQTIGLSISPNFKNKKSKTTNPDYVATIPSRELCQFEYSKDGSWVMIDNSIIDPHTTETIKDDGEKGTRKPITKFSRKSRKHFQALTSKINTSKVNPKSVLFITLTSPAIGWRDVHGKVWKQRLNNFNTQLRQKFKSQGMCGFWRLEFGNKRKAPHFHLVTYNIPYIDHQWVAEKWNNICCKDLPFREKQKHLMAGTQVAVAKEWKEINDYNSKTMSYFQKNEEWKHDKDVEEEKIDPHTREWMKGFGAHWGVISRDNLYELFDIRRGELTKKQFHQVKRIAEKMVVSSQKKRLGKNYNKKKGAMLTKIFKQKHNCKYRVFIQSQTFEKVLELVGLDITDLGSNHLSVIPSKGSHTGKEFLTG